MLSKLIKLVQVAVIACSIALVWSVVSKPAPEAPQDGPALAQANAFEEDSSEEDAEEEDAFGDPEEDEEEEEAPARAVARHTAAQFPTEAERRVKDELEAQLRGESRADRVVTAQGRVMTGRILGENDETVRLLRNFGDSGDMEVTLQRSEIRSIERAVKSEPPTVSFRDVRFKVEFPDFHFYRRPPFTIVTDQSFFEVEDAYRTLEQLHKEFAVAFAPLITRSERSDGIQLLFFSDEKKFNAYRDEFAPALGYASGFYSPVKDRLVIFDQLGSEWVNEVNQKVDEERARYMDAASRYGAQESLNDWHSKTKRTIGSVAERANRAILRHEGAHQLFHTYGVHSQHGAEHLWLIEGLATLWEHEGTATEDRDRFEELRQAGKATRAMTFRKLVDYPNPEGFGAIGKGKQIELAYPKSVLIVEYLMSKHREAFFEYIRYLRDPANERVLEKASHFEVLARFLDRKPDQLEKELVRRLAGI